MAIIFEFLRAFKHLEHPGLIALLPQALNKEPNQPDTGAALWESGAAAVPEHKFSNAHKLPPE